MSTVIEVVIGMSLVFLIAAAGASAINELAEGGLRRRSKYLRVALGRATNAEIAEDLYATKWVRTLMTPMGSLKKAETADADVDLPSYIPSDVFAAAIRELLDNASDWSISALEEFDDTEIAQALESVPDRVRNLLPADLNSVAELRARLQTQAGNEALLSEAQKAIVAAFPPYVFENLDDEARNLQRWYEATMDRLSGWYKRRTRWWLILWGALIAVCFNIDSFAITRTLWTDEAVRDAAVATATEYVKNSSTCTVSANSGEDPFKCVDQVLDQLKDAETLGIPLGWNRWPWQYNASITETIQQPVVDSDGTMIVSKDGDIETQDVMIETLVSDDPRMPADGGEWIMKLLGLLGTAVAVSLGASVWFDILNKFVGFRASGVKPPPGGTSGALDQPSGSTDSGSTIPGPDLATALAAPRLDSPIPTRTADVLKDRRKAFTFGVQRFAHRRADPVSNRRPPHRGTLSSEAIGMAELDESLLEAFARHAGDPDHREVVIVTVEPGHSIADVDGVTVHGTARAQTIVMGTANERGARELAVHDGVLRIERDSGDMGALE